jgi:hypothetical protein
MLPVYLQVRKSYVVSEGGLEPFAYVIATGADPWPVTHHAASVVATVKVWSPKLTTRSRRPPVPRCGSEMILVGGEHGLVVWQVLLDAQARGPP